MTGIPQDHSIDYHSLTEGELDAKLKFCMSLRARQRTLRDGGAKLDKQIQIMQGILESKTYRKSREESGIAKRTRELRMAHSKHVIPPTSSIGDEVIKEEEESEVDVDDNGTSNTYTEAEDLANKLEKLKIPTQTDDESDEDILSQFPPDPPLTTLELANLRTFCNLPPKDFPEDTIYHPYVFQIGFINATSLVRLVIADCLDPERHFTRTGHRTTWSISNQKPSAASVDPSNRVPTVAPWQAFLDAWSFLSCPEAEPKKTHHRRRRRRCLLLAESATSLENLRRLFCCPYVRSRKPVREKIPGDLGLGLCSNAEGTSTFSSTDDVLTPSLKAALAKCTSQTFDPEALKVLRVRDVAWLEAPLNLSALLNIASSPQRTSSAAIAGRGGEPILSWLELRTLSLLATVGFVPRTLSRLAGAKQWRGFSGLLYACGLREHAVVRRLYENFKRVYERVTEFRELYPPSQPPFASHLDRGMRALSLEESMREFSRSRDAYQVMLKTGQLPERPSVPPKSDKLLVYREPETLDSDDDADPETDDGDGEEEGGAGRC